MMIFLPITLLFYFAPTAIAWSRSHRNVGAICLLNFFLGWTLLGWVAALVWSVTAQEQQPQQTPAAEPTWDRTAIYGAKPAAHLTSKLSGAIFKD